MNMKYVDEYRDPELARRILLKLRKLTTSVPQVMEVSADIRYITSTVLRMSCTHHRPGAWPGVLSALLRWVASICHRDRGA